MHGSGGETPGIKTFDLGSPSAPPTGELDRDWSPHPYTRSSVPESTLCGGPIRDALSASQHTATSGEGVRSSVDVHNFLLDSDVPHEISSLPGPLRDLADAPEVLGLPSVAVARSVVLADEQGVVVVVVPARSDLDQAAVASLPGRGGRRPARG
jgi:hypothetical protein